MASGEEDDLNIPVFRIDDSEIVDLAALLDDNPAASTPSKPTSASGWDEVTFEEPTSAETTSAPTDAAGQQQGNVFHLDISEDSDFEALLSRTMGPAKDAEAPQTGSRRSKGSEPPVGGGPRLSERDIDKMLSMLDDGPDVGHPEGASAETGRRPARGSVRGSPASGFQARGPSTGAPQTPPGPMSHQAAKDAARAQESKAVDDLRQKVKDMAAETDRYKARIADEAEGARAKGREDVFKALMPIIDTLELALNSATGQTNAEQFTQGITLVLKRFEADLKQLGLEVISPEGETFNPKYHEALQRVSQGKVAPGCVAEVVRRGYRVGDKLLRAAQVFVEAG